jgi:tetrapyrrole methylase family protein/MazG family protein
LESLLLADAGPIWITGLGPGDLASASLEALALLKDTSKRVICRTLHHPAAVELAEIRHIEVTDRFYEEAERFEDVYQAIAEFVVAAAGDGPVIYAVPGGPLMGETAAGLILELARSRSIPVHVVASESFVEASLRVLEHDALKDGLQVLDGRDLRDPLFLHLPTLIGHVDVPVVLANVIGRLQLLLPDNQPVVILTDLGAATEQVREIALSEIDPSVAGLRVSLFFSPVLNGLPGAIATMQKLRDECPWDAKQTHKSILPNLVEEAYELYDAIAALDSGGDGEPDWVAFAEVEEELGDVLLQVLFHATMGAETGAFSLDSIGEELRQKLTRRHPHVFADGNAETADEVLVTWDEVKSQEKDRDSVLDGVARSMPAIARAAKIQQRVAKVGFDWDELAPVVAKLQEEIAELLAATTVEEQFEEFGDVLFSLVNVARHLSIDPDQAARAGVAKFERRFRIMESLCQQDMSTLSVEELQKLWEQAKQSLDDEESSVH